jgi:tetratricopeptide (TPR) repeat protein
MRSLLFKSCILRPCLLLPLALVAASTTGRADSYQDRLERAVSFYSDKHFAEAAAILQSLVESNANRKDAYLWLGHSRSELQDWASARDAYKKYVDLAPKDVEGPRGVARTYESEGNRDLALLWYRKALELEPSNERLKQAVARLDSSAAPPASPVAVPSLSISSEAKDAPEKKGFWSTGLAGLVGAREVWWGRVLAVILFAFWLLSGAQQGTRTIRERMPNVPEGVFVVYFIVTTAAFYIAYWGIPSGSGWGLMGLCILAAVLAARASLR